MTVQDKPTDQISFEDALRELEQIVQKIDSGQEALEDTVRSFERAMFLKQLCQKMLNEAQLRVDKILEVESSGVKTVKFE